MIRGTHDVRNGDGKKTRTFLNQVRVDWTTSDRPMSGSEWLAREIEKSLGELRCRSAKNKSLITLYIFLFFLVIVVHVSPLSGSLWEDEGCMHVCGR